MIILIGNTAVTLRGIDPQLDTGLYTAVGLGEEHIVFLQGETIQHHTGRKDYLVVSLVSFQSECQSAGAGLEITGCGGTINGRAGSG